MTVSAAEQFLLEMINRARLDPAAEAARLGIDLNKDLSPGTISTSAKQVLAANSQLEQAAVLHSQYMLNADVFSHTGAGNSNPGARITAQGYAWSTYGENIALAYDVVPVTVEGTIARLYEDLFLSKDHRPNTLKANFTEVGLGAEAGLFTIDNTVYHAVALTEDFAARANSRLLTGVTYADANNDGFYGMGEATAGVVFKVGASQTSTATAGGYALEAGTGAAVAVTGQQGALNFSLKVDMRQGNVKLDLVGGTEFFTSGSVTLGSGVNDVQLLGIARINATGSAVANEINGNKSANILSGMGGADILRGNGGLDVLDGGRGNDRLTGGSSADTFVFGLNGGTDRITDFSRSGGDILRLDDALWAGQTLTAAQVVTQFGGLVNNHAVLEFAGGEVVHLLSVTTLTGLDGSIALF